MMIKSVTEDAIGYMLLLHHFLYSGLAHPQILVPESDPGTSHLWIRRDSYTFHKTHKFKLC